MRPVPRLSIDYGDGRKLERTLRGNVATYLCTSDGHVPYIVPGLCDPQTFLARLQDAVKDAAEPATDAERAEWMRDKHAFDVESRRMRARALERPRLDGVKYTAESMGFGLRGDV